MSDALNSAVASELHCSIDMEGGKRMLLLLYKAGSFAFAFCLEAICSAMACFGKSSVFLFDKRTGFNGSGVVPKNVGYNIDQGRLSVTAVTIKYRKDLFFSVAYQ